MNLHNRSLKTFFSASANPRFPNFVLLTKTAVTDLMLHLAFISAN